MTRILPADVEKEFRALALPWIACLSVIVLGGLGTPGLRGYEVAAYFIGICTLGGLSFGQEYTYRTMPMFLSLPSSRQRLYLAKFTVLALMLLSINLVMIAFNGDVQEFEGLQRPLWLSMACCLFIGPWMTMVSRNPLAGAIFGMSLPALVFVAYQWTYFMWTGSTWGNDLNLVTVVVIAASATAAVAGWRKFMRLEALDGGGRDLRLPSWSGTAIETITKRNPAWLLIKKEIALQQISMVLGGVLVVGWMVAMTLRDRVEHMADIFNIMTLFYSGSMAMMIGAIASAEERQLGTHEWHALLPMSAARQWRMKVVVVLMLTLILSVLLPSVLMTFMGDSRWRLPLLTPVPIVGAAIVASLGLYFSSLSTSSVRALVIAVPAIALGFLPGVRLNSWEGVPRFFYGTWHWLIYQAGYFSLSYEARARVTAGLELVLAVGFIAMVLRFALTNHRSAAPIGPHLWRQGLAIALCLSAAAFILAVRMTFGIGSFVD